ncbi:MAG: ferredoxin [Patescibacteria group bacterium]
MTISKIVIDRSICIGAATCYAIAPKAFSIDAENKAVLLGTWSEHDFKTIMEAAQSCPVNAILLFNENGNQVWPQPL